MPLILRAIGASSAVPAGRPGGRPPSTFPPLPTGVRPLRTPPPPPRTWSCPPPPGTAPASSIVALTPGVVAIGPQSGMLSEPLPARGEATAHERRQRRTGFPAHD